ncbi:MBL fold metallo-hydrolase [Cohnella caldifontis]|uniref:MBL fold metallo-hydrolase n=1 Tax=Cohnella caldifontis TaxID=3027471 RepID=UPI0023ECC788|nr:MBL fold metallo-hydrolase [Cohnella sp. YIM B05605]
MMIDRGVEMIELQEEAFGQKTALHPVLIWDETSAALIDTGMPGSWERIKAAMADCGVAPEKLAAVILTHQDFDHVGSIEEIRRELGDRVKVYAHPLDRPYIEGDLPLTKTTPEIMEKTLAALPEEPRKKALALFANPPKTKVDAALTDGQLLPFGGGLQVIHTPGHTEGHVSLYLPQSKILLAVDAMMIIGGKLHGPVPQTSLDLAEARRSVAKFLDYDIETVVCYHGGLLEWEPMEQIRRIAAEADRAGKE